MNEPDRNNSEASEGLRGLRESVNGLGAGPHVEAALLAAFRSERARQPLQARPLWPRLAMLAAAAAVVVTVALVSTMRREDTPRAPLAVSQPPVVRTDAPEPIVGTPERVVPRRVRPAAPAGEFIPLVPDLRWEPGESGQIMRVSFPRSALQSFGLPVNENRASEMVSADILVGQDMVARAIRVVR